MITCFNGYRAEVSKLLSPIYALLLVLVGVIFPITEALYDKWLESIYNMVSNQRVSILRYVVHKHKLNILIESPDKPLKTCPIPKIIQLT